jgi:predicted acetyltransferase
MAISLRWVGKDHAELLALIRCMAFKPSLQEAPRLAEEIAGDGRLGGDDCLLLEIDGQPVGTTTSLSFNMWVRGRPIPCQGVADVSVVKTHRRRRFDGQGVATRLLWETLRLARERGQIVSALMPFRVSFYEHFGYGAVERRNIWTVPTAILPPGDFDGFRFYEPRDAEALFACRQQAVERGQCDIERSPGSWKRHLDRFDGYLVVDRPTADGPIEGYLHFTQSAREETDVLHVTHRDAITPQAFRRQLHFLASLRDQYAHAVLTLPADVPLNWMLRETQLPHRRVNHPAARLETITRMQLRILDHMRFLAALTVPEDLVSSLVVRVLESEGHASTLYLEFDGGRVHAATTSGTPQFICPDRVWAAIACGELRLNDAVRLGLAESNLDVLPEPFCHGRVPWCDEYF